MASQASFDVEEVLSKLTATEKISLLSGIDFWHTQAIPRLGIPSIRMSDGPNGIRGTRFFNGVPAACFPCGTAMGATWDQPLMEAAGKLMAAEAYAKGAHIILGPTVNMQRSPLGGRGFESFSEDPVLAGLLAAAEIRGIQSTGTIATIKHFVCNDQEHERKAVDSIITERALREIYLLPFQLALRDSDPWAFMSSYNKVNGRHVSESYKFLQETLRDEWGFNGMVMSDWFGTYSVSGSIKAGLDLEMPGPAKFRGNVALAAFRANKFTEDVLDERARNVLTMVKKAMKLNIPEGAPERTINTPETAQMLRKVGAASLVLLKNESDVLPFKGNKTTAVIGSHAKISTYAGGGSASLLPYYAVTPFQGITEKVQDLKYASGPFAFPKLPLMTGSLKTLDGKPGFKLSFFLEPETVATRQPFDSLVMEDTMVSLADYKNPKITSSVFYGELEGAFTPEEDGEYDFGLTVSGTAKLFVDGKLVVDNATKQRPGDSFFGSGTAEEIDSVKLSAGSTYTIKVQWASAPTQTVVMPGATVMGIGGFRVACALRKDTETEIQKAVSLAKEVDQVIICVGLTADTESEGYDRQHMDLPKTSDDLIKAVLAANPNTAIVVQSGTPVTMPWADKASAIVQAWYGGNETGNAIADVLFGDVNPSGKLPLSFPYRNEHNPAFLNFRSDRGRAVYGEDIFIGYRFYEKTLREVLFPFGHGLSYTKFKWSNLQTSEVQEKNETIIKISVDVSNVGEYDGAEVVQAYVTQEHPSITRPPKELKGFAKVFVPKGETKTAEIQFSKKYATSFWDERKDKWVSEKDQYKLLLGSSSAEILLEGGFEVEKTTAWRGL